MGDEKKKHEQPDCGTSVQGKGFLKNDPEELYSPAYAPFGAIYHPLYFQISIRKEIEDYDEEQMLKEMQKVVDCYKAFRAELGHLLYYLEGFIADRIIKRNGAGKTVNWQMVADEIQAEMDKAVAQLGLPVQDWRPMVVDAQNMATAQMTDENRQYEEEGSATRWGDPGGERGWK